MQRVVAYILLVLFCGRHALADDSASADIGNRWLLIACGLPGDDEHRERLTLACEKLIEASGPILGVETQRLSVLAGDETMQQALAEHADNVDVCTADSMQQTLGELAEKIPADDACWVMLLGHANLYRSSSYFNVEGADFDHAEFGRWTSKLTAKEQVFWVTLPVSGFWTRPLSHPSRVVITATEADLEFTGTEMPYALADVLTGDQEYERLSDIDGDGELSLLDLYLTVNVEIAERFLAIERLQTEHASLDDNGDGSGSEVQEPYVPVADQEDSEEETDPDADEGDAEEDLADSETTADPKSEAPPIITQSNRDGFRSRHIRIQPIQAPQEQASDSEDGADAA